jgi:outer membrane protein OmpA-like peptidoglycan-associated protein
MFAQSQAQYEIQNLGPSINSKYGEIAPVISPDGRTLYYVRTEHPDNKCNQAIWFSTLQADSTWGAAERMGAPFNLENNNSINSLTADGATLLIPEAYHNGEYMSKGYSFTHRTAKGWSKFQSIGMKNYEQLAKGNFAYAQLSNDGNKILMCFSPTGNDNDNDLFVSFRQEDDTWSEPANMGKGVNTTANEISPFLASDGVTLYFASNRSGGYGMFDIYFCKRLDNSFTNWTAPKNLGPEFNSDKSEAYYTLDAKGEWAYLSSTQNSMGAQDIVRIKLKQDVRPQPVVLVEGFIVDKEGKPIEATINYEVLPAGVNVGRVHTDPRDGSYKIVLPYGNEYGYTVTAEGHFPVSSHLDLTSVSEYKELNSSFELVPIRKGESVRINNVFFGFNSAVLLPASLPELKRLVDLLKDNSRMVIEIGGHTDNVGTDDYNKKLSQARAESVLRYLNEQGIKAERLSAKGYGFDVPAGPNDTEEGRAFNRRVEFTVVKK